VLFDPGPPSGVWATPTTILSAPEAREGQSALWTGSAMVIWGGWTGGPYVNTGGLYDPAADDWVSTGTTNAPHCGSV